MPNRRLGFGAATVKALCDLVETGRLSAEVRDQSVGVLKEYQIVHQEAGFSLPEDVADRLDCVLAAHVGVAPVTQPVMSGKTYFKDIHSEFPAFARSRHSVRHFIEGAEISMERIESAIEIARTAPSACNRQPIRVHVVANKALMTECLKLQNGNRGFGHLGDKLLVVTGKVSSQLIVNEFFGIYVDGGIFLMNLAYGLHYNQVAHCILNWFASPEQDEALRQLLRLPEDENVIAYVLCGEAPAEFKQVASPRLKVEDCICYHR